MCLIKFWFSQLFFNICGVKLGDSVAHSILVEPETLYVQEEEIWIQGFLKAFLASDIVDERFSEICLITL